MVKNWNEMILNCFNNRISKWKSIFDNRENYIEGWTKKYYLFMHVPSIH